LVWLKIMINFQEEPQNLKTFAHFEIFIFKKKAKFWYFEDTHTHTHIYIYKLQNIAFKISSYEKNEMDKKNSVSFYKVIPLAHVNVFWLK